MIRSKSKQLGIKSVEVFIKDKMVIVFVKNSRYEKMCCKKDGILFECNSCPYKHKIRLYGVRMTNFQGTNFKTLDEYEYKYEFVNHFEYNNMVTYRFEYELQYYDWICKMKTEKKI